MVHGTWYMVHGTWYMVHAPNGTQAWKIGVTGNPRNRITHAQGQTKIQNPFIFFTIHNLKIALKKYRSKLLYTDYTVYIPSNSIII
jgi:hypothetical protein